MKQRTKIEITLRTPQPHLYRRFRTMADLAFLCTRTAPDATQIGEHTVTQKHLYTGLFVIGIPMLWWAGPFSTVFWLAGASGFLIIGHASLMEPGIESEYAQVQEAV